MKVAILIERFDTTLGGAERSVCELLDELRLQGVDATVLAAAVRGEHPHVLALCSDRPSRTPLPIFVRAVRRHLRSNKYDIVHSTLPLDFADVYQPRGGSYREAMLQNAASCGPGPRAWLKRLTHPLNRRRLAMIRAEARVCAPGRPTIVAALSDYVKSHFTRHYRLPDDRIAVIPNGVKPRPASPAETRDLEHRLMRDLPAWQQVRPILFLFAANNFRLKGLDPLLRAFARAFGPGVDPGDRAGLLIAGAGGPAAHQALARRLGIADRILFLGPEPRIREALELCDVAVLPTWYDPSSRFILEALAAGRPAVTTRFNGAAEMIQHHRHGALIDRPDDIDALADALVYCADFTHAKSMSNAIMDPSLQYRISIARHARQLVELYESILQRRGVQ